MPKKHIIKPMDPVPTKMLGDFVIQNCTLTTLDKPTYDTISNEFLTVQEGRKTHVYGQGTLAYSGYTNSDESKIIGCLGGNQADHSSYLIRSNGKSSFDALNQIIKSKPTDLTTVKVMGWVTERSTTR